MLPRSLVSHARGLQTVSVVQFRSGLTRYSAANSVSPSITLFQSTSFSTDSKPPQDKPKQRILRRTKTKKLRRYHELTSTNLINSSSFSELPKKISKSFVNLLIGIKNSSLNFIKNPITSSRNAWKAVKDEAKHYYHGGRLFWLELTTSTKLLKKRLKGNSLSRRERNQLTRTSADMFRVIPFSFFVLIPFLEFALPVVLKIFPNMLPSTFSSDLKKQEQVKANIQARLEIAEYLQDVAKELTLKAVDDKTSDELQIEKIEEIISASKNGEPLPKDALNTLVTLYSDEAVIDNMSTNDLFVLARYMGINVFLGSISPNVLRYQIRQKISSLREDDKSIFYEGIDSLNEEELRQACMDRGMMIPWDAKESELRSQLNSWLKMSMNRKVSTSLLLLSRAYVINERFETKEEEQKVDEAVERVVENMSKNEEMNKMVVAQRVEELLEKEIMKDENSVVKLKKLEAIALQNQLIEEEQAKKLAKQAYERQIENQKDAPQLTSNESINSTTSESSTSSDAVEVRIKETDGHLQVKIDNEAAGKLAPEEVIDVVQSIVEMSSANPVESEKGKLTEVQAKQAELELEEKIDQTVKIIHEKASPRTKEEQFDDEYEEEVEETEKEKTKRRAAERLNATIKKMLLKIEKDLDSAESEIGDTLNLLDKDRDGKISRQEIKQALETHFCVEYSEEVVNDIIVKLDLDNDGIISIEEAKEILRLLENAEEKKLDSS